MWDFENKHEKHMKEEQHSFQRVPKKPIPCLGFEIQPLA